MSTAWQDLGADHSSKELCLHGKTIMIAIVSKHSRDESYGWRVNNKWADNVASIEEAKQEADAEILRLLRQLRGHLDNEIKALEGGR